jgi:adenylosuccinate synthase
MRKASTFEEYVSGIAGLEHFLSPPGPFDVDGARNVIIEGTQGYGLGLHTGFYPQTTSSDCRAIDFLAMAGISPWQAGINIEVILVARVYPIRVAGNSGPLMAETTWAELGLPEERTTVTNNVRRVGAWDDELVFEAIEANGGGGFHPDVKLALTMLDHRFPDNRDMPMLSEDAVKYVEDLQDHLETFIEFVGTGPQTVVEL